MLATPIAAAPPDALVVPILHTPVTLDGRISEDAWRHAARIDDRSFARWTPTEPIRDSAPFQLRLFHDGTTLYVALVSYDRFVEGASTAGDADGLYAFSAVAATGERQHYRLRWSGPDAQPSGQMRDVSWGARRRGAYNDPELEGGGYVLEFGVPFAMLRWTPGATVRVNVIVHNHDGNPGGAFDAKDTRFTRFAWGGFNNDDADTYKMIRLAP